MLLSVLILEMSNEEEHPYCWPFRTEAKRSVGSKRLEADHDDPSKKNVDDVQKTEISISADGHFGDMKKALTRDPSKRPRVCMYAR